MQLSLKERLGVGKICELEIKDLDRKVATFTLPTEK